MSYKGLERDVIGGLFDPLHIQAILLYLHDSAVGAATNFGFIGNFYDVIIIIKLNPFLKVVSNKMRVDTFLGEAVFFVVETVFFFGDAFFTLALGTFGAGDPGAFSLGLAFVSFSPRRKDPLAPWPFTCVNSPDVTNRFKDFLMLAFTFNSFLCLKEIV